MNNSVMFAMIAFAVFITAWFMGVCLSSPYKRHKMWQRTKCFFGKHKADTPRAEVGGRNVQRCMYCDTIVYEYTVTKNSATKTSTIRRTY